MAIVTGLTEQEIGRALIGEFSRMHQTLLEIVQHLDAAGVQKEDDGRPLPLATRVWLACQAYEFMEKYDHFTH